MLHPGGGSNPGMVLERKRWLPERWAAVADELHAGYGAQVLIVGSAAEAELAARVQASMHAPAMIMAQQWRWGVLAALIERAALFMGHDTGMSLLANAVGAPHLVVFGPSDPQMYGPMARMAARCGVLQQRAPASTRARRRQTARVPDSACATSKSRMCWRQQGDCSKSE